MAGGCRIIETFQYGPGFCDICHITERSIHVSVNILDLSLGEGGFATGAEIDVISDVHEIHQEALFSIVGGYIIINGLILRPVQVRATVDHAVFDPSAIGGLQSSEVTAVVGIILTLSRADQHHPPATLCREDTLEQIAGVIFNRTIIGLLRNQVVNGSGSLAIRCILDPDFLCQILVGKDRDGSRTGTLGSPVDSNRFVCE